MSTRPTWDETFMELCHVIAKRSKDQSTQLGAVIVDEDNTILSMGYNCFPRGINDDVPERQERPIKYKYFEHAERNAIYNASRSGVSLLGSTIYVPMLPCSDCARGIIQSGIRYVVVESTDVPDRWKEDAYHSVTMLTEARVLIDRIGSAIMPTNKILLEELA
ncbi:MAG: CMP deaminase [Candidatus Aenigmatarchaeota archaeon]|nr:MAG: CMP deaminase [Candidatus Aenigmarchaeota archaeon]